MIIKLKYEIRDNHVHARVMMGHESPHFSHCGILTFTLEEWKIFKACVANGTLTVLGAEFMESDATDGGSSSSYPRIQLPPDRS